MSPAHRACTGCGAPAVYGPWCLACASEPEVNLVNLGDPPVWWNRQASREELDAAVGRALGR